MKVNFGIYLGNSSAAISKMEAGDILVYRSDTQRDYIPLCVMATRKGLIVGDKAISQLPKDKKKSFTDQAFQSNIFIEFTRTLGTDISYFSSIVNKSFSSEELLAEVIKSLRSFVEDENVEAAVITVPASFEMNQINAVRKAGYLAGLKQIEIIIATEATFTASKNAENNFEFRIFLTIGFRKATKTNEGRKMAIVERIAPDNPLIW